MRDGLSSLLCSRSLLPQHYFVFSLSDVTLSSSELPCFVLFCYHQGDKWERRGRGRKPRGWCPHIITTPSIRPLPISALHLSVFLSDSWQPVGYSGQASIPRCIHLPTDLRKHILARVAIFGRLWPHGTLITAHGAWRPLKHATVRPQQMNPVGHTQGRGHTIKSSI